MENATDYILQYQPNSEILGIRLNLWYYLFMKISSRLHITATSLMTEIIKIKMVINATDLIKTQVWWWQYVNNNCQRVILSRYLIISRPKIFDNIDDNRSGVHVCVLIPSNNQRSPHWGSWDAWWRRSNQCHSHDIKVPRNLYFPQNRKPTCSR